MKYIIVSVNKVGGRVGSDTNSLFVYFELGWEMATTYLLCRRMYKEGKITQDDVIVTQKDRMFLYQSIFNNVISYDEYLTVEDNVEKIDLVEKVQGNCKNEFNLCYFGDYYTSNSDENREYKYYNEDKDIIIDFKKCDVDNLHKNEKYITFAIRKRDHASWRNMSDEWTIKLINRLKNNINIFVVGKDAERFCDNEKVKHVNLQKYATLCNNSLCVANIGPLSGIMYLPSFFSNAKHNIIFDVWGGGDVMNGYNSGHPLYLAKCVRYSKSNFIIDKRDADDIANFILKEI